MYQCRALSKLSEGYYEIMHRAARLRLGVWDLIDQDDRLHGTDPNLRIRISVSNIWRGCLLGASSIPAEESRNFNLLIMVQRDTYRASSRERQSLEKSPSA
jgi:hypothetical protein